MFLLHILILGILGMVSWNFALNFFVFRKPPEESVENNESATENDHENIKDNNGVRVSVLIPARNEERNIERCLKSLEEQTYQNYEIIVLDDRSSDRTSNLVRARMKNCDRIRLISGTELPDGWTGKAWACLQLAKEATGEVFVFTDADTWHAKSCLARAVVGAEQEDADLYSLWPRQETGSIGEKLVIPLVYLLVLGFLPQWILWGVQRLQRKEYWWGQGIVKKLKPEWLRMLGAANGQYLLFRKSTYWEIGGHEFVRDHLVEDIALGRAVASRTGEGMRVVNADGSDLLHCRMYRSSAEVWEGFTKNLRPAFEASGGWFFFSLSVQFTGMVLPFLLWPIMGGFLLIVECLWILGMRLLLGYIYKNSFGWGLLHPIGHLYALSISLNSWRSWAGDGVVWKGRRYQRPE